MTITKMRTLLVITYVCSDFTMFFSGFETGSHYVALAGLKLARYTKLAFNSQKPTYVSLPECSSNTPNPRLDSFLSVAVRRVRHQKEG